MCSLYVYFSLLDEEVLPGGASREEQWRAGCGAVLLVEGLLLVPAHPNLESPASIFAARSYEEYVGR